MLRFLPPEAEKAWSEALSAHSVAAYTAAEMMWRYDTKLWMRDLMEGAAYLPK